MQTLVAALNIAAVSMLFQLLSQGKGIYGRDL